MVLHGHQGFGAAGLAVSLDILPPVLPPLPLLSEPSPGTERTLLVADILVYKATYN